MNLIGEKVTNAKYGTGTIMIIDGVHVTVQFAEKVSKFKYPEAFQKHITLENETLQAEMNDIATAAVEAKAAAKEKAKAQMIKDVMQSVEVAKTPVKKETAGATARTNRTTPVKRKVYASKNIAFKCTYNDGGVEENGIGFTNVCSDALIRKHAKKEGIWCSNLGCPCKDYYDGIISREQLEAIQKDGGWACYESVMLIDWIAEAGTHRPSKYDEGIALRIKNAFKNSLAILTTRIPGSKEKDRFVFAIFIIGDFFEGDDDKTGYVQAHPRYRMQFTLEEGKKLPFWKYHANKNQPSKPLWGTGLFRYIAEDEGVQILRDAVEIKKGSKDEQLAKDFLHFYCDENRLDSDRIGEAEGALTRCR